MQLSIFLAHAFVFASAGISCTEEQKDRYQSTREPRDPSPRYRNIDSPCSNDKFPSWGSANISYARRLPSWYEDASAEKSCPVDPKGRFQPLNIIDTATCTSVREPCNPSQRYRNIDGTCTNDKFPHWGSSNISFARLLPAWYEDGKSEPRKSITGEDLPNARTLSVTFFHGKEIPDHINTMHVMQLAQMVVHDCINTDFHQGDPDNICCTSNSQVPDQSTVPEKGRMPIKVPPGDYFFDQFNATCLRFIRARYAQNGICHKYPVEQINFHTAAIDGGFLYGNDEHSAKTLRTFSGGKMVVQTTEDGRPFPMQVANTIDPVPCFILDESDKFCFFMGDTRININSAATFYMIAFLRLHNYLCDGLALINPHWDDETLYQTSRRIVDGFFQKLIYKDCLPICLGENYMRKKGILVDLYPDSCINFYNPYINPSIMNEFAAATFRVLHSLVPDRLVMADEDYHPKFDLMLADYYFRPTVMTEKGNMNNAFRGMCYQGQKYRDPYVTEAMTNKIFKLPTAPFGSDLEAQTILRGRDTGLLSYNQARVLCGIGRAETFEDFGDVMSTDMIEKHKKLYNHVDDVDLYTGCQSEWLVEGSLLGPTALCISGEQFYNLMYGDRFYYENCGQPWSFTKEQLKEIQKLTISWLFCVAGDGLKNAPINALHTISDSNPIVLCSEIPHLDFTCWKE
uniref:Peroxidase n=1 Tax=Graphocephala atropunctata TaxID=36148 RepID=A0A1B6KZS9_9HEMI